MTEAAAILSLSAAAVVEDVLRQHGCRLSDRDLASRRAEEAAARRNEAAGWLRRTIGAVAARDLPEEPSEEEFRLGLRNGQILCGALNRVHPGAVPKVVVNTAADSVLQPDGPALSAFQYFENVRNFLVATQEIGLPCFEASDLEQGGKSARVVNCVLALKSYGDWKQCGGTGPWKYGGTLKPSASGKPFVRKNSEPFRRCQSMNEGEVPYEEAGFNAEAHLDSGDMSTSRPLKMLVSAVLSDKRPDEVPQLLESMLSKLVEEFENRLNSQNELIKAALKNGIDSTKSFSKSMVLVDITPNPSERKMDTTEMYCKHKQTKREASREVALKQHSILQQQSKNVEELKADLITTKAGMEFMQMKYSEDLNILGRHLFSLAHAASGYHKVLEENRKLYNQVQDLKGSIRVYCRVRPFLPGQASPSTVGSIDEGNITIVTPSKSGKEGRKTFGFNKVFGPSATQDEVFLDTQPLIRSVLDGYNVCIFAYGQTGSGKTYTMSGPKNMTEQTQGVNYRALSDLFKLAEQRKRTFMYDIAVQMIEIYNEQVRDLLVNDGLNKRLEIRNNSQNGLNVPDASLVRVASTMDVMELMNVGHKNRAVGATALNDRSSRSHSCLTVHVQGRDLTSGTILHGCMHLVDLAGSERVDKSEVTGDRLKEAQHINKSLSALGDVIASLAQKNVHVPYRNSKLTQLLQDSLGGQAKTLMFVHISPESDAVGETISTLKFAERVSTVELGAARLNKESGEVKELKEQIARLKSALAAKDSGLEQNMSRDSEAFNMKMLAPGFSNRRQGSSDLLSSQTNFRQPMEDVGNIEVRANPTLRQKKPSFDIQDLLTSNDSPSWPDSNLRVNFQMGDERVAVGGDWMDKVVLNNNNSIGDWEGDSAALPDFFYQRYHSGMREKQYQRNNTRQKDDREIEHQRPRFYSTNTDDSDDIDMATSDSSESDAQWQLYVQSMNNSISESGSKVKKPQTKIRDSSNSRTPIHSQIPSASRKDTNGSNRSVRQPLSRSDSRRLSSNGRQGTK
ncbi:kinesin-like protein KIN-14F [Phragmites australis]|uniref:kinesin-like protein KIN-14F n=1 Tax=Phragmites australis TaxID=29695 RepID=UPI002D79269F|nr:kinesin-like protein KIN-14F [Phragmites australis]